jgi:uncharacterized integral membrane protein
LIFCLKRFLLSFWTQDFRYSRRFRIEIVSMSCWSFETMTWKIFFFSKFFFTIVTIFIIFWEIFAIEFSAQVELWFLFWKQLFFDVSLIVFCVFDELLFAFVKTTYRFRHDKKKVFFLCFFYFCSWKKRYSRSTLIFWDLDSRF